MIARIWQGTTKMEHFEAYTRFLITTAIPDYKKTDGFEKLTFLRKIEGGVGHFTLITYWQNLAVIKNFAGNEVEKAKYYPEDQGYLLNFEEKVNHFEVFAAQS